MDGTGNDACFWLAPEAARNWLTVRNDGQLNIETMQQSDNVGFLQIRNPGDVGFRLTVQTPDSWIRMTRTRSSAMASRSTSSSRSLPSTWVSSQV